MTIESPRAVTLTLRGAPLPAARVGFTDDVVDNENLGRRKSKCEWNDLLTEFVAHGRAARSPECSPPPTQAMEDN